MQHTLTFSWDPIPNADQFSRLTLNLYNNNVGTLVTSIHPPATDTSVAVSVSPGNYRGTLAVESAKIDPANPVSGPIATISTILVQDINPTPPAPAGFKVAVN